MKFNLRCKFKQTIILMLEWGGVVIGLSYRSWYGLIGALILFLIGAWLFDEWFEEKMTSPADQDKTSEPNK